MARRPSAPRPRGTGRSSARPTSPRTAPQGTAPQGTARRRRTSSPTPAGVATPPTAPAPRQAKSSASTAEGTLTRPTQGSRSVGRPRPEPAPAEETPARGRVVEAADRFRELVTGRPWRRRRRQIIASLAALALVLGAALAAAVFLPALQIARIDVQGTGYVDPAAVEQAAAQQAHGPLLLLPAHQVRADVEAVPGVSTAEVERSWPDGVVVTVTEGTPVAQLKRSNGTTAILDSTGEELPEAAADGASLMPLAITTPSADPEGAAAAMIAVLDTLPDPLRGATTEITASSDADVTLTLQLEDGGTKTVVWGDAEDAALKADVVQALLGEPGSVIDVSSPVAPVTR